MKTQEIADFLSGKLRGEAEVEIRGIADLATAGVGELAFTNANEMLDQCKASCVLPKILRYLRSLWMTQNFRLH